MAKPKRYYWMKLKETFMTSDTIDYFMSQPDGANYVVLYQMLCLKTINTGGRLSRQIGELIIPYDAEKIQRDCKWFSIDTVRIALNLYKAVGLIYEERDGTLVLTDHASLVGSETSYAIQKRNQREFKNQLPTPQDGGQCADNSEDIVHPEKEIRERDKRLDIRDIEIEKDIEIQGTADEPPEADPVPPRISVDYVSVQNLYNSICIGFPQCSKLSDARKRAIKARFSSGYTLADFETLFSKAVASHFLRGQNSRNWRADFDWLIKDANMAKVLSGNYDDHDRPNSHRGGQAETNNPFLQMLNERRGGGEL